MNRNIVIFWMVTFSLLLSTALPVSGQTNVCDPAVFDEIDVLLAQAQEALNSGNIISANVILSGLRAAIAPCIGGDVSVEQTPLTELSAAISQNSDWTPVIQEFDGVEMVLVPAGCFNMGSANGTEAELPVHQQCFDEPFWIDRYEVSNAQRHSTDPAWASNTLPLAQIGWGIAREVCLLREARLPTEAEWEYAARGPDGLTFPWGNEFIPENLVYRGNASETDDVYTHPEGASWVGAFNMSGNVMEWTSTLSWPYPYDANDRRELVTSDGAARILRGGSFYDDEFRLRASYRIGANTSNSNFNLGVRCVRPFSDAS